jgi:hypothetical protein
LKSDEIFGHNKIKTKYAIFKFNCKEVNLFSVQILKIDNYVQCAHRDEGKKKKGQKEIFDNIIISGIVVFYSQISCCCVISFVVVVV